MHGYSTRDSATVTVWLRLRLATGVSVRISNAGSATEQGYYGGNTGFWRGGKLRGTLSHHRPARLVFHIRGSR